jgi:hypothetical protein
MQCAKEEEGSLGRHSYLPKKTFLRSWSLGALEGAMKTGMVELRNGTALSVKGVHVQVCRASAVIVCMYVHTVRSIDWYFLFTETFQSPQSRLAISQSCSQCPAAKLCDAMLCYAMLCYGMLSRSEGSSSIHTKDISRDVCDYPPSRAAVPPHYQHYQHYQHPSIAITITIHYHPSPSITHH